MSGCCGPEDYDEDYDEVFDDRFAGRVARGYRRRGLDRTRRRIVDFVSDHGLEDATVLEIGGGVGELHVELLRRGARAATNLEISAGYEHEATRLLEQTGLRDRVTRRRVDIAVTPDDVPDADVVVLHRVVCCYPDAERLLAAASRHARRLLVFSHPPRNVLTRSLIALENSGRRLRGRGFRAYVHVPEAMVASVEATGLVVRHRRRGLAWTVVGLERPGR
ncbi:MAG TPA: methyltransferase domain-containing protein [Marmoricola sp.]|nr:methyltransferase domain-containing protein [Marmoricola sp.]